MHLGHIPEASRSGVHKRPRAIRTPHALSPQSSLLSRDYLCLTAGTLIVAFFLLLRSVVVFFLRLSDPGSGRKGDIAIGGAKDVRAGRV